jgi:hypothetical protein
VVFGALFSFRLRQISPHRIAFGMGALPSGDGFRFDKFLKFVKSGGYSPLTGLSALLAVLGGF